MVNTSAKVDKVDTKLVEVGANIEEVKQNQVEFAVEQARTNGYLQAGVDRMLQL